jgi:cytochrome c553
MIRRPAFTAVLALAGISAVASAADGGKLRFNQDIRPIFSDKCFACHGFDAKKRKADRRLDTPDGAYAVKDDVKAIAPGDLAKSEAWKRILSKDDDEVMPPPESHKKLSGAEKTLIRRWIEEGAAYEKHWAFEPSVKVAVPEIQNPKSKIQNPIDAFIGDRLKRERLEFSPEADRETLVRRVAFALTGLPPTVKETDAFLADQSPDAYEKMVDRYLASPRHGEEMARHWLDVARYGDTHGLHLDNERQMWAYRDWVVRAFNGNLPFDKFTTWQLAGDLIPNATQDQLTATGFNRCNVTTSEGGAIAEEFTYRYAVDRTSTMMETWMGLTGGCAVCHDHKFDPITTKEFYSLYSFFQSNADPAMDGNLLLTKPVLQLATPAQEAKMKALDGRIAPLRAQMDATLKTIVYTDPATLKPPPPAKETETVWIEDDFPPGANAQHNGNTPLTQWVTAENGHVFSGKRALKRSATGLAQDYYSGGAAPFDAPQGARFFLYVFLDPANPPEAVMLQIHTGKWESRAVWGNPDVISYGQINSPSRFGAGALPEPGKWARLEVEASAIDVKPSDKITGVAFTLHGGTAYFDHMGVVARVAPATDPTQSFLAWEKFGTGKDTPGLPAEINAVLKTGAKKRTPGQEAQLRDYYLTNVCAATKGQFAAPAKERNRLQKERDDIAKNIPSTFVWNDLEKPRDSFVMMRGQYDKPGDKVEPATPAIFPPLKKSAPDARATRLDLAAWLLSPEHPLTARVTVNRFWQQFFGTGIVKTSYDFGSQGSVPSHPELLDWLAVTFRESGWDVRKLIRLMLTSATFRQSSVATPDIVQRDPENILHARGPRFRLDAEQLRDNALFVSGLINLEMGGKGVRTYQPPNIWEPVGFGGSNTRNYTQDTGPALYRRSLYVFLKRTAPPPFMTNFDAPNREQFCTVRERSDTPLQALQLMNDVQHFEAARAFAERIMTEGGTAPVDRITFAYRAALSRKPTAEEIAVVQATLGKFLAEYSQSAEAAKKVIHNGESKPKAGLPQTELAAWTLAANLILNLDETINRN